MPNSQTTTDEAKTWPATGLEPTPACPICSSVNSTVLHTGLADRVFSAPGLWTLKRCTGCQSAYLDPRPSPDTLGLAYQTYYTHETPQQATARAASRFGTAARRCVNGYRNLRFGTELPDASQIGGRLIQACRPIALYFDCDGRHLQAPAANSNRLLDVGCGNGKFLELAQRIGWSVTGTEIDDQCLKLCQSRGLQVSNASLTDLIGRHEQFDVITSSHVVEHVYDPLQELRNCFALLRPGGTLWIETPNINSLGHKRFGSNWRGLEPPRHLAIFTPESLKALLSTAGFTGFRQMNRGLNNLFTYSASNKIANRGAPPTTGLRLAHYQTMLLDLVRQYVSPASREFITLICTKPRA